MVSEIYEFAPVAAQTKINQPKHITLPRIQNNQRLGVRSRGLMVQSFLRIGRIRYGPSSSRQRHDDRGGPSSNTRSQESLRALAARYSVNPKTILKWKKRSAVADLQTGPGQPKSSVLSVKEEAIVIAFRRQTLLPLDDFLYALLRGDYAVRRVSYISERVR